MFGLRVARRAWWTFAVALPQICRSSTASSSCAASSSSPFKVDKAKLREKLTPEQYHVTQEKGTERAFSGVYNNHEEPGTYRCVVCNDVLFSSESKFSSGCGWPAFSDVLDQSKVKLTPDLSHGMERTEVTCGNCRAHLGHVFDDGPRPTGKRFCINSCSLNFEKKKE